MHALVGPVSAPVEQTACHSTLTTVPPPPTVASTAVHSDTLHSRTYTVALPPVPECSVFAQLPYDDTIGTSHNNKLFIDMMDEHVDMSPGGSIELPLPLRPNFELPHNNSAIYMHSKNTMASIKLNPIKTGNCRAAMQNNLEHNFVEEISPNERCSEFNKCFDIPGFTVVQSKPSQEDKIRLVYDASAKYKGISLAGAPLLPNDGPNALPVAPPVPPDTLDVPHTDAPPAPPDALHATSDAPQAPVDVPLTDAPPVPPEVPHAPPDAPPASSNAPHTNSDAPPASIDAAIGY